MPPATPRRRNVVNSKGRCCRARTPPAGPLLGPQPRSSGAADIAPWTTLVDPPMKKNDAETYLTPPPAPSQAA